MSLSLIVAISQNGVIGRDGRLPWHLPEDLRRFKSLTMGHHIIMGRRTFESLGRCLPGRTNVVVSQRGSMADPDAIVVRSLPEAMERAAGDREPFVIGGARIFEAARPCVDRVYLTRLLFDAAGDTCFDLSTWGLTDPERWRLVESSETFRSRLHQTPYQFETWERATRPLPRNAASGSAGRH